MNMDMGSVNRGGPGEIGTPVTKQKKRVVWAENVAQRNSVESVPIQNAPRISIRNVTQLDQPGNMQLAFPVKIPEVPSDQREQYRQMVVGNLRESKIPKDWEVRAELLAILESPHESAVDHATKRLHEYIRNEGQSLGKTEREALFNLYVGLAALCKGNWPAASIDNRTSQFGLAPLTSEDLKAFKQQTAPPPTKWSKAKSKAGGKLKSLKASHLGSTLSSAADAISSDLATFGKQLKSFKTTVGKRFETEKTPEQIAKHEERKELRTRAKAELPGVKQTLKIKTTALRELQVRQVVLAPQQKGLSAIDKLRNFAHEKTSIGERIVSERELNPPNSNQVIGMLSLEGKQRTLTGEIEKLRKEVSDLEAKTSKKSSASQGVSYWGDKIFAGLARRGGMGRAGQIAEHTIPASPILPIRLVQDTIAALGSVKTYFSNRTLNSHIRSLEKMGAVRLEQVNSKLHARALERQMIKFQQNPSVMVTTLSQHPDIRDRLLEIDLDLSHQLTNARTGDIHAIQSLLDDKGIALILSQDKDELDAMKAEGELKEEFKEKEVLLNNLRPVMDMRAQLTKDKDDILLGMNLYKMGTTLVDVVQTSIGIAQFATLAEPTKIGSILVGALKIILIVPTFPLDYKIIRANLKDAAHSLSNLSSMRESYQLKKGETDPIQAIGNRIKELEKTKNFDLKREIEPKQEEIKILDKALKLLQTGKIEKFENLLDSSFSRETQYLFKPQLKLVDQHIDQIDQNLKGLNQEISETNGVVTDAQRTQLNDLMTYRGALTTFRDLVADSGPITAKEILLLSHPRISVDALIAEMHGVGSTDLISDIKGRRTQLSNEASTLQAQLKNNDPSEEMINLLQAARALEQEPQNIDVLKSLFNEKKTDGTPLLSLKSQQAIRPNLKAVDDRLQELTEREGLSKDDPEIKTLREVRRQIVIAGVPRQTTLERLSPESQAVLKADPLEKAILEAEGRVLRLEAEVETNPRSPHLRNELDQLHKDLETLYNAKDESGQMKTVLDKGKKLFLDGIGPYMKQRLRQKRITEWIQVASDLLAIGATMASVAGFALLVTTGWGAIPAFAVVVLLLCSSTIVRYGGSFAVDVVLKGQERRRIFKQAVERGEIEPPKNWKEKFTQGLNRAGIIGSRMDKRQFYPAVYSQIEDELKNWDAIKASGQTEKTLAFTMYHLVRNYLPQKLPAHVDPKRYAEMLTNNEGNTRKVFYQAVDAGMLHHDLSRLSPRKMIQIANRP